MLSPINSKVLSLLSLLVPSVVLTCAPLTVRAELDVEWIDANTIRVTGTGYGPPSVVTNLLGCCTNCTLITPAELDLAMESIISKSSSAQITCDQIIESADSLKRDVDKELDDISTFRHFGTVPTNPSNESDDILRAFSNYFWTVQNTQTELVKANLPSSYNRSTYSRLLSYSNGIYDYSSEVSSRLVDYEVIIENIKGDAESAKSTLIDLNEECYDLVGLDSCPCGDDSGGSGGGTNGVGCAWTADQVRALLDYVDHIDKDQHKRFDQLNVMSNHVSNIDNAFDSYAKLVSGVLYNDSTITFADGETWTNVYLNGESEGYNYDKSNILQRIELILFGMAYSPTNTFSDLSYAYTNELDDADVENVTNRFDDFSSSISNGFDSAYRDFRAHVDSLKSIDTMFVFWGQAGSASPFVLGQVPDLGGSGEPHYITVGNDFLGSEVPRFRMLCRYAFQLLWAVGFLFMIWEFYVRLFKYVVVFLKYVCEWLNECFAS